MTDLFPPEERKFTMLKITSNNRTVNLCSDGLCCSGADVKEIKKQVKYLLQNLQDSMNTLIFTQDSYKDGCWLINPDVKKFSEVRDV